VVTVLLRTTGYRRAGAEPVAKAVELTLRGWRRENLTASGAGCEAGRMFRAVTFNLHRGAPMGSDVTDPDGIAAVVAALDADVLALQEIDIDVPRSGHHDLFSVCRDAAPGRAGHFARTVELDGGSYGIGLVVRGSIDDVEVVPLTAEGEARSVILARVVVEPGARSDVPVEVTVAATHLQNNRREARTQLIETLALLAERPGPHLLMGDLNVGPFTVDGVCMELAWDAVASAPTFPADTPRSQIDWVVTRGLRPSAVVVPDVRVSDHRPVVVELDVAAGQVP